MSQPSRNSALPSRLHLFATIRAQLTLTVALLAALMLAFIAVILLTGIPGTPLIGWQGQEKETALQNLGLVADLKQERLVEWIQTRRKNMQWLAGNALLSDKLAELEKTLGGVRANGLPEDRVWPALAQSAAYQAALQYLVNYHQTYAVAERISIVTVPEGRVLVSTDPAWLGQSVVDQDYYSGTLQSSPDFFGQVHPTPPDQRPNQHAGHVVRGSSGQIIGILVLEINPDEILRPLLQTGTGLGASGEVVLVNQSAQILTSLKYPLPDGTRAQPLVYQNHAAPAQHAAQGQNGVIEDLDYRGVPVLAAYRYIPVTADWGWGMVVKQDRAEVYAPMTRATRSTLLISLGGLLLLTALTALLTTRLTQPLRSLGQAAQALAQGDLKARVTGQSSAEGQMVAAAFNQMAHRLGQWYSELDQQVQARTAELNKTNLALEAQILERQRAEHEQARLNWELAEKNAELEQIVYVTSHDLRSPLVNIQGFGHELGYSAQAALALAQAENVPPPLQERLASILAIDIPEALHFIQASAAKMDTLLSGLLRLSRLGRAPLIICPLDMNAMARTVLNTFRFQIKDQGVRVTVDDLPPCVGDENQINQVFSNLLDNALKYLDPARPGCLHLSGEIQGQQVVYCVEDNGIGIAPEHFGRIFELFHRLDPAAVPGEGLGLTIVRRILGRHGGSIHVESRPGAGSRFLVTLPK